MPFKPLPCRVVIDALVMLGFTKCASQSAGGTSHEKWECVRNGIKNKVTVDCHRGEVRALDVKSIIGQAGVTKAAFWAAVNKC